MESPQSSLSNYRNIGLSFDDGVLVVRFHTNDRYTRLVLTQRYQRLIEEGLESGLTMHALAALYQSPTSGAMKDLG